MYEKYRRPLVHVYPPFPSFAWVMSAQANPPSPAYAFGYVQSALVHTAKHAHHTMSCRRHGLHPRSTWSRTSSPARTRVIAAHDEGLMKTVDYRYHDPPSRPYVPWHEGYSLRRQGAQQRQGQLLPPHQQQQRQHAPHALPPSFAIAAPAFAQTLSTVATTVSGCGFASSPEDARPNRTATVDVVKIKRLVIVLGALRRACGFSKAAHKTVESKAGQ